MVTLALTRCSHSVRGLAYVDRIPYLFDNDAIYLQDSIALYCRDTIAMVVVHVNRDDTSLAPYKGEESEKKKGCFTHHHYQSVLGDQRALALGAYAP